jgi:hypothetical protein
MDINRMKLGLVYIFSENDKLGKEAKIQLINFIEGANEHQLKSLALDGTILRPDQLDEQACSILNDRFAASFEIQNKLKEASLEASKMLSEVGGAAKAGAIGAAAGAAVGAGVVGAQYLIAKKRCKKQFPNDPAKVKQCMDKARKESLDLDSMLKELDQEKFNTGVKVGATVGAAALAARQMMKRRKEKAALKAQQMQQKMQQAKMAQK